MTENFEIRETNEQDTESVVIAITKDKFCAKELLKVYKKHFKKGFFKIKEKEQIT